MKTFPGPAQSLDAMWFEYKVTGYDRLQFKLLRDVPECVAHAVIAAMEAQGFRFVPLGSSPLPPKE